MAHPNPQGWLVETLQFVVMSMNRKTDRETSVIQGSLDDVQPHHHDDYHEVEFRPLLSPEDYELIEMTVVQRYTIPEAAEELGITVEACKKRKQRAILRMRERFLEKKAGKGRNMMSLLGWMKAYSRQKEVNKCLITTTLTRSTMLHWNR